MFYPKLINTHSQIPSSEKDGINPTQVLYLLETLINLRDELNNKPSDVALDRVYTHLGNVEVDVIHVDEVLTNFSYEEGLVKSNAVDVLSHQATNIVKNLQENNVETIRESTLNNLRDITQQAITHAASIADHETYDDCQPFVSFEELSLDDVECVSESGHCSICGIEYEAVYSFNGIWQPSVGDYVYEP